MRVLSLFDGISCGMVALERAGVQVDKYVAYEIDENAIKISRKNYPQIEHCGDVTTADFTQYKGFDLLIGGSPCQDLCAMGSREGLKGKKSSLFFEYVRALKEIKPKYFLFENNASMTQQNKDIITSILGIEPIMINSADLSAQNRKRLYWTNILVNKWQAKKVTIGDIAEPEIKKNEYDVTDKVIKYSGAEYAGRKIQKTVTSKIKCMNQKSNCLGTHCGDYGNNTGLIIKQRDRYYIVTPTEAERLQTLPDDYTAGVSDKKRYFAVGNGWTVDVIAHIFSGLERGNSNEA